MVRKEEKAFVVKRLFAIPLLDRQNNSRIGVVAAEQSVVDDELVLGFLLREKRTRERVNKTAETLVRYNHMLRKWVWRLEIGDKRRKARKRAPDRAGAARRRGQEKSEEDNNNNNNRQK